MSTGWAEDPGFVAGKTFEAMLDWATRPGVSRIGLQTGRKPMIRRYGINEPILDRALGPEEMTAIVEHIQAGGEAALRKGQPLDLSYVLQPDRRRRLRYRVNATSCEAAGVAGNSIVVRPIADKPLALEEQHVEKQIMDNFDPGNGMVLIGGATGSGKTTLVGGFIRHKLETPNGHYDIVEASAPVEILYDKVDHHSSTISQNEVPRDLLSFSDAIRAFMRQEPTDIVIGECRDAATMEAAIQAAISGHLLTSSIHTNDVSSTIRRIVSLCPSDQRDSLVVAIAESLRLIVNQRLVASRDGRRTAIREFVVFDARLRGKLLDAPAASWPLIVAGAMKTHGRSFADSIAAAVREDRITTDVAARELSAHH